MRGFLFVEIESAGGAASGVEFDFVDVGVGANFAATGFFGGRNGGGERSGLRTDFTSETQAEAAVDAGAAARTRLRKNGQRRGEGMPAEFASAAFEDHAATFHR